VTLTQSSSRRAVVVTLIALLVLGIAAVVYRRLSVQAGPAVPRIGEISRLHIHLEPPMNRPHDPLPPPFDAPPDHLATLLGRINSATEISKPATTLSIGYLEAWYGNGKGLRVELFLVASNDTTLSSKDLVLSTPDGIWRRDGKFVEFADEVRAAYRDYQATAR
jgi:hypothetical protein